MLCYTEHLRESASVLNSFLGLCCLQRYLFNWKKEHCHVWHFSEKLLRRIPQGDYFITFSWWADNFEVLVTKTFTTQQMDSFYFNPIQDGSFRGCSRMEGAKRPLFLKYVTYILKGLCIVVPYLKKIKNIYITWHPMSSADISIFSLKISNFCYVKKYRYRSHFDT